MIGRVRSPCRSQRVSGQPVRLDPVHLRLVHLRIHSDDWQRARRTRIVSVKLRDCGTPVDTPPPFAITNPAQGATVSGSITVTADATDNVGVTQVEFFADEPPLGVDTNSTDGWSASWNTTTTGDGSHTVSATATDTIGRRAVIATP